MTQTKQLGTTRAPTDAAEDHSIAELLKAFPDQWILMSVTKCNERHEPARGIVVARSKNRKQFDSLIDEAASTALPGSRFLIFFANHASLPRSSYA